MRFQNRATIALRELGYLIGTTEYYNSFSRQKTDLFHFLDAVGVTDDRIIGLQFTGSDFSPHIKKLTECENAEIWNKVSITYLIGVKKMLYKSGGKAMRYYLRVGYFNQNNEYIELQTWKSRITNLNCILKNELLLIVDK